MPIQALANLRIRLDHALLALAEQDDVDGTLLRQDTRSLLNVIVLILDTKGAATPDRVPVVLSRGHALIERIRLYADVHNVYLPSGTMSETQIISTETIRQMLAEMHPGANEPPAELMPSIVEAFEV